MQLELADRYIRVTAVAVSDREQDPAREAVVVDCLIGPNWVLTVRGDEVAVIEDFRALATGGGELGALDAPSFLATLLEWVVTSYSRAFDEIESTLEEFDVSVLRSSAGETEQQISVLVEARSRVGRLRRALAPHRELFAALGHSELDPISTEQSAARFEKLAAQADAALASARDAKDAVVSSFDVLIVRTEHRTNEIVKVLTLASILLLPGALIAGIMGMNVNFSAGTFAHSPLFWTVDIVIIAIGAGHARSRPAETLDLTSRGRRLRPDRVFAHPNLGEHGRAVGAGGSSSRSCPVEFGRIQRPRSTRRPDRTQRKGRMIGSHGTSSSAPIREAKAAGEDVARSAPFEWLSRAGFLARGAIYGIIGILALELAVGAGGKATNQQGALKTIAHQPFGKLLLILVAVGLGGYAAWRFVRAALGHGPEGSDSGFDRVAALASGIVYAGLCVIAVRVLIDERDEELGQSAHGRGGSVRLAGRHVARRHRRGDHGRRRSVPGLPRAQQGLPRRLEDRGDEARRCGRGSPGSASSATSPGWSCSC